LIESYLYSTTLKVFKALENNPLINDRLMVLQDNNTGAEESTIITSVCLIIFAALILYVVIFAFTKNPTGDLITKTRDSTVSLESTDSSVSLSTTNGGLITKTRDSTVSLEGDSGVSVSNATPDSCTSIISVDANISDKIITPELSEQIGATCFKCKCIPSTNYPIMIDGELSPVGIRRFLYKQLKDYQPDLSGYQFQGGSFTYFNEFLEYLSYKEPISIRLPQVDQI